MWLFVAFLVVPLIEIALFIQVGGWIGLWPTLGIVVLTAILGTWLVRTQGRLAIGRLRSSLDKLDDPTEPLAHGAMILIAGALLLTPGFFTDAVGFALLTPGIRQAAFTYLHKRVRVEKFEMGGNTEPHRDRHQPRPETNGDVIDGDYEEVSPPKKPTHRSSGWTKH
ncbi:FxsA family protein [Roseovarius aestuariivivens]|uniref:FxsA family protein n=1 Tax=Roseovarius aestuariivivens TaxID=1888910 RepID=UPI001081CCC7|nr:FxsA family protein [Roseovarius aestuariivivens]